MNKALTWVIVVIIVVLGIYLITDNNQAPVTGEPIKIGAILSLTSNPYADNGVAMREGIDLYVDSVNSEGGIDGREIEIIYEDSKYDPASAVTAAQKLINVDQVSAVLISTHTEAMAVGDIFEEARVPLVVLWDSNEELENMGEYVFGTGVWTPSSGERIAEYATKELEVNSAAIAYHNTDWSSSVGGFFENKFSDLGGEVVFNQGLSTDTKDFRTLLLKIQGQEPDAIFFPLDRDMDIFLRQAKELGIESELLSVETVTQQVIDNSRGAAEGVYYADFAEPQDYELTNELKNQYREKYGEEPKMFVYNGFGYDGALSVMQAIENSGSDAPEDIKDALYKIVGLKGSLGVISFNDRGSAPKSQSVFMVEDSQQVFVTN